MVNINVNTLIGVDPFTYSNNNSYIVVIGGYRHKTTYLSIKPPSSPDVPKVHWQITIWLWLTLRHGSHHKTLWSSVFTIYFDGWPWWFSMASPVNVITRLGTSVCNPNRLIDRSGKNCINFSDQWSVQLRSEAREKPCWVYGFIMVYPREFVSQNWLKGIRSVETPKNDRLVGGWPTHLKHMKVNGKDYPIYYGK